jgi:predicted PurR-regulated permease PerM
LTEQSPLQIPTAKRAVGLFRVLIILALTILAVYVCYLLVLPFLPALAWALTLTLLFLPVHEQIEQSVRRQNVAAAVSVVLIAVVVVVPGILLGNRLIQEAASGAAMINELSSGEWLRSLQTNPRTAAVAWWIDEINLPEAAGRITSWVTERSGGFIRASVGHAVTLVLTFYLVFYFLRDREAALNVLIEVSPLPENQMRELFRRVAETIHATLYGTLIVAAVQGTLGGLIFWWLALPAPLLWGVVMGALAIVPVLGAFVVWIPAAVFLALNGNWLEASILTVWGAIVVGGIDNVLYPMLVGDRIRLHTIPTFIAIVGGLTVFGASGVILGPLTVTVTIFLLRIWGTHIPEPKG